MQVEYRLSTIIPCVYYGPEALFLQAVLPGKLPDNSKDMVQQLPIGLSQLQERGNMLLWDEEEMNRGLGVNVLKGQHSIIFIDDFTGDLFGRNTTENTPGHATYTPLPLI